MPVLKPGDRFPDLELTVPGGTTITLPDALAGSYGVVLFYRGHAPAPVVTVVAGRTLAILEHEEHDQGRRQVTDNARAAGRSIA